MCAIEFYLCKNAKYNGVRPTISYESGSAPYFNNILAVDSNPLIAHQCNAVINK
jgi:hypothetical protein